jgi:hypothetical protein
MALADAVLRLDANGSPRTVRLLAALVEFESRHFAEAASRPAENELVRAFRGGATPTVPIAKFLESVQRCNYLYGGAVYVLAGAYLARFMRTRAARDAGILVEPATAHRLVCVAVLLGAKFSSPRYFERRFEAFQICSGQAIRASEMSRLEMLFLRAVDGRLPLLHRRRGVPTILSGHGAWSEGARCKLRIQEEESGGGGGAPPRPSVPAARPRI